MDNTPPRGQNYWTLLKKAEDALQARHFVEAERWYLAATGMRDDSPGRVLLTEKLTDGLGRLFRRGRGDQDSEGQGRWSRRTIQFQNQFLDTAEEIVRQGIRLAELRPEDEAEANQPVLETSLFLVSRSRIFSEEPASAVPLLKGLFRTARRLGRPFDVNLVRHDIPLTEEDRLWLARRGVELLDAFVDQGRLETGSQKAQEWAQVILQLLQTRYFGSTGRLEEERSWLEAVTADRLLGRAIASVDLYRAYLEINPEPGQRSDEARVRLMELFANVTDTCFAVPQYEHALGALQSAGLSVGSAMTERYQDALATIEYRRPEEGPDAEANLAWASVAVQTDGRLAIVYWWGDEPRDLAFWKPGDEIQQLSVFLDPCQGRIVGADASVSAAVADAWTDGPAPWSVRDYTLALLENRLPAEGLQHEVLVKIGLGETASWRKAWRAAEGHPLLEPPRSSSSQTAWQDGPASGALLAGLLWLAIRSRVSHADPSLRAGIGEMFRRGDRASGFLYEFLTLGQASDLALDSTFEAWTLPLLWTRSDPFGWTGATVSRGGAASPMGPDLVQRPDLGRNDLAIVSTGDPASVLASWGDGRQKWRVVLDRMSRMEMLGQIAANVIGPVTIIPPGGRVHSLQAALDLLENRCRDLPTPEDSVAGLLQLFHWVRLVETHNGDLLDFLQVRPRQQDNDLYEQYKNLIEDLPQETPLLEDDGHRQTWASQFSQRVRKAGLVAGPMEQLSAEARVLDSLWGVYEGADASWVFLDSAAIHWHLMHRQNMGIQQLHALLFSRGGRHLSLLGGSVLARGELETLLGTWLGVFGPPYCLSLTDTQAPVLGLAANGVVPNASLQPADSLLGQLGFLYRQSADNSLLTIQVPSESSSGDFWNDLAEGELSLGRPTWSYQRSLGETGRRAAKLVVPALVSLDMSELPIAGQDTPAAWVQADAERRSSLAWRRKLCSLEMAALLSGHWKTVDILDTRWWRTFRPLHPDSSSAAWTAEVAAARLTDGRCRTVKLPTTQSELTRELPAGCEHQVRHWLSERGKIDASGRGILSQSHEPAAQVEFTAVSDALPNGRQIKLTPLGDSWQQALSWLTAVWEKGDLQQWGLIVADEIPPEAAFLVAAAGVESPAIWSADDPSFVPGPLLWCRPADFRNPALAELLTTWRPAFVLAHDLAAWLPAESNRSQTTALALRALLDSPAQSLILHASPLTEPWVRFMVEVCQAQQVGSVVEPTSGQATGFQGGGPLHNRPASPAWGDALTADAVVRRLAVLLKNLRRLPGITDPIDPSRTGLIAGDRRLIPLTWLACQAGVPVADVQAGVRILRWVARLSGDALSDAGADSGSSQIETAGHTLMIRHRFAELENILNRLEGHLSVVLPLWLGELQDGPCTWVDLALPPVHIDPVELDLLDRFLLLAALQYPRSADGAFALIYECPRGAAGTFKRLVGYTGQVDQLTAKLREDLRVFRARINDIISMAVETGDGFLVETGLTDLRPDEQVFLALGSVLDFWLWSGPSCAGAHHLVDLLTVADSPTAQGRSAGWRLVSDLCRAQQTYDPAQEAADRPRSDAGDRGRWRTSLAGLLPGADSGGTLKSAVERVVQLVNQGTGSRLLVIRGLTGTGRHEALLRGLLQARQKSDDPTDTVIYCSDVSLAAQLNRQAHVVGLPGPLDIRVVHDDVPPAMSGGQAPETLLADRSVVVICEIQRFAPETRYRIAQLARQGTLIMTADPAASTEPWENLFLTTPRASDVMTLDRQSQQARRLWSDVRQFVPRDLRDKGTAVRKEKGLLRAEYAANLDQCLGRILAEADAGDLPPRLRLLAPLASDLDYLGSSLRDRGWLVESARDLAGLMLPGSLEFLAVAADLLGRDGGLREQMDGQATPVDDDVAVDITQANLKRLTPRILAHPYRDAWATWFADCNIDPSETTLAALADQLVTASWAAPVWALPAARARLRSVVARWSDLTLAELPQQPLWLAWWYTVLDLVQDPGPRQRRPLVTVADVAWPAGEFEPGGIYLCLGTEPDQTHYRVMSRITDNLLVLYQEKSPLPGETAD